MNKNKKTTYESKNYIIFFGKIFIAYRPESKDIVFRHFIGGWRGGGGWGFEGWWNKKGGWQKYSKNGWH